MAKAIEIPAMGSLVSKKELRSKLGFSNRKLFQVQIELICNDDPGFAERYGKFRAKRYITRDVVDAIIRFIEGDDVSIEFVY